MAERLIPPSTCIRCGAEGVVKGRIMDNDPLRSELFVGTDLSFESGKHSASISAYACPTCGHVELRVDVDNLATETLPIGCPHCGGVHGYVISRVSRNEKVTCQNCGRDFQLTSVDVRK
ncbi:MAG: hypothetical protein ACXADS_15370 [Candidatus Thorarchaeota archaeon]|jgi:transcription elongation factor Elf1